MAIIAVAAAPPAAACFRKSRRFTERWGPSGTELVSILVLLTRGYLIARIASARCSLSGAECGENAAGPTASQAESPVATGIRDALRAPSRHRRRRSLA